MEGRASFTSPTITFAILLPKARGLSAVAAAGDSRFL